MANLGIKVETVLSKFYFVQPDETIKGLYEVREKENPEGDIMWYFFSSNNATFHSSGNVVCIPSSRQLKKYKIFVLPGVYRATFLCRQSLLFMKFRWC